MPQIFKVGDKVRILDASKIISGASRGIKDGDIYEVVELYQGHDYDPIIKLDDGLNFGFMDGDHNYIEKVAEDVTKFKVGDKVRIISTKEQPLAGFMDGDIVSINDAYKKDDGEQRYEVIRSDGTVGYGGNDTFEKVSDKPTKNQRIKSLESEVAELKAKVDALEQAQKPTIKVSEVADVYDNGVYIGKFPSLPLSPNEQRKAIIAEAKAFVDAQFIEGNSGVGKVVMAVAGHNTVEFVVNPEKRTVVAILRLAYPESKRIVHKAIAKCAPDDVFNADIGKAIALGRALGLDVKRFEQAVKPTEVVVGMVVEDIDETMPIAHGKVTHIESANCHGPRGYFTKRGYAYLTHAKILDDTEAQYGV